MKAGKTYRYKKTDHTYRYKKTDHTYLCLFVGETSAFLRRLSDGLEFLERDFSSFSEVKPKKIFERWVNLWGDTAGIHPTKELADRCGGGRTACIHIRQEYEEGEGL